MGKHRPSDQTQLLVRSLLQTKQQAALCNTIYAICEQKHRGRLALGGSALHNSR
jgi:hypothetical protein